MIVHMMSQNKFKIIVHLLKRFFLNGNSIAAIQKYISPWSIEGRGSIIFIL